MKGARSVVLFLEREDEESLPAALEQAEGFQLLRFPAGAGGALLGPRLAAAILWRRAAVVHVRAQRHHDEGRSDLACLRAAKLCGAAAVYETRAFPPPSPHARGRDARLRRAMALADVLVVPGKRELDAYRKRAPAQTMLALPEVVDHRVYSGIARPQTEPEAPLRLLYIGRLAREEGLYDALQGLRLALVHEVPACLTIAGSGPDEPALKRFAHGLGLESFVSFAPAPADAQAKLALLRDADVFLLPTVADALPRILLEAMAAGLPAIVPATGAVPEAVTDGMHGLFVRARDAHTMARAMATFAADREVVARMAEACRARIAAGYSVERLQRDLTKLYSDLVAGRSMKPATGA
jgi:glycosyltransferase involved in cell wall biosynthesis